mmetsp:Transcript_47906/g.138603  ORF Transcript_47906/g.138603 Transcript_47906/m.138603 type:complete len:476 (+) Transcript_47906:96-1523(+)
MDVPAIVHQTAPGDRNRWDPRWAKCQDSWHRVCPSPGREYIMWDDDGLRALVAEAFPDLLAAYDGYEQHIQRVDFARAAMLYLHGGLYVDMDVEVLRDPFPHLRPGMVTVVASPYPKNEKHQNSMMASPPKHPFWRAMADEAVRRQRLPGQYRTTWQLTGPQLLDAVVEKHPEQVYALPHAEFNPAAQSPTFNSPSVFTRHFCTSVWTHNMDTKGMALYQSVRMGYQAKAADALDAGADIECRDYAGLAPMHHAGLRGDTGMITLLASFKADVGAKDKNDTTPLHYAVQVSCLATVQRLLEYRADTRARLRDGSAAGASPLDLAWAMFNEAGRDHTSTSAQILMLLDPSVQAAVTGTTHGAPALLPAPERKKKEEVSNKEKPWWAAATSSKPAKAAPDGGGREEREAQAAPSTAGREQRRAQASPSSPRAAEAATPSAAAAQHRCRCSVAAHFQCRLQVRPRRAWKVRRRPAQAA